MALCAGPWISGNPGPGGHKPGGPASLPLLPCRCLPVITRPRPALTARRSLPTLYCLDCPLSSPPPLRLRLRRLPSIARTSHRLHPRQPASAPSSSAPTPPRRHAHCACALVLALLRLALCAARCIPPPLTGTCSHDTKWTPCPARIRQAAKCHY